jgi:hypothetical protein
MESIGHGIYVVGKTPKKSKNEIDQEEGLQEGAVWRSGCGSRGTTTDVGGVHSLP